MNIKDKVKIRAYNLSHLRRQIKGRRDCIIFIPYFEEDEENE